MADTAHDHVGSLETLNTRDLQDRWRQAFGRSAPKRTSRDLLLRALAYRLQEKQEGGLSKSTRRRLARLAGGDGKPARISAPIQPHLKPGTRLVREWRGEVHRVAVLDDGFDYRGSRYTSLSRIAREITGTRWSGPLFFGLRDNGARSRKPDDDR
jgi:hypothetical protein